MFARSTTVQAHLSSLDAGIAHMREEVMPELEGIPGCIGLSLLVDRRTGRCIATSAWESREAMRDSATRVSPIRDRAAQMFSSSDAEVQEWEIAVLHRDHRSRQGACVGATWGRTAPDHLDSATQVYKSATLPAMEELDGFCSASLMIDRATGHGVSCATYDSTEAMERNRQRATALRGESTRQAGVEVTDIGEFELAIAHLHVPELV
ncbi:antibiotic biosynthesis monooxygenase [Nocardia jiangxiensis]|uniref:Antibiotic biosynthesis monooxygenase n=1 Tax=Nocardia jiangxiensis TaxID=282685 RepID=A0ABW6SFN5_9NOCA|nr:antibiotic biosynthesis monooxygenase [Nocardia jiangxiensis]